MKTLTFRPKNLVIEAFQVGIDEMPDWILKKPKDVFFTGTECFVGTEKCSYGDYVLQSLNGDIFTCTQKTFDKIFESVQR